MFADFTEEVDGRHRLGPVEVVDESRGVLSREIEELGNLCAEVTDPFRDRLAVVERPLRGGLGVTDESGRSADQTQRVVPLQLDATQEQQLNEIPEVQARGGRVEPAVIRDGVALEECLEFGGVSRHVHEPAPFQFVPQSLERRVVRLALECGGVDH